jgi:hypothetical protein
MTHYELLVIPRGLHVATIVSAGRSAMSRAAVSVLVFGLYMLGQGALLLVAPNLLLTLLGFAPALDVWPRVAGIALMVLGLYYLAAARGEWAPFFRVTVAGRTFQLLAFIGLVGAGLVSPRILGTAGLEFVSGLWTLFALRQTAGRTAER